MTEARIPELSWEAECETRIEKWRLELENLAKKPDAQALQSLKAAVDVQLALADLKIKTRQADWAKTILWFPLVLPMVVVIVGAVLGAFLKH